MSFFLIVSVTSLFKNRAVSFYFFHWRLTCQLSSESQAFSFLLRLVLICNKINCARRANDSLSPGWLDNLLLIDVNKRRCRRALFYTGAIMARDFAVAFYHSPEWTRCRKEYIKSVGGLCERCRDRGIIRAGVIVHHINHVSPETIQDPAVLTNPDNLMLVCRDCHAALHKPARRFKVDDLGRVSAV